MAMSYRGTLILAVSACIVASGCTSGADGSDETEGGQQTATSSATDAQSSPTPEPSTPLVGAAAMLASIPTPAKCSTPTGLLPDGLFIGVNQGVESYSVCELPNGDYVTLLEAPRGITASDKEIRERARQECKRDEFMGRASFPSFSVAYGSDWIVYADSPTEAQNDFVQQLSIDQGASGVSCGAKAPQPVVQVIEEYQGCAADEPWSVDVENLPGKAEVIQWTCTTDNIYDLTAWSFNPAFRDAVVRAIPAKETFESSKGLTYNLAVGDDWLVVATEGDDPERAVISEERFRELIADLPVLDVWTGTTGSDELTPGTASTPTRSEEGWIAGGNGLFWRWVEIPGGACDLGDRCWAMEVEATQACLNGLYAEITIKDAQGRVIDWTNDTVNSLAAGEIALLDFYSYEEESDKAFLTQLRCWN